MVFIVLILVTMKCHHESHILYVLLYNHDHAIDIYKEVFSRHRPIMKIYDKNPILAVDTFVAPNASIIGKVREKTELRCNP